MDKLFGLVLWLFGITCGLLVNLFGIVYNLGWQDSAKKIAQDFSKTRNLQQNVIKKGENLKNE